MSFRIRLPIFVFFILLLFGCSLPDCDKIDLKLLQDIKFQESVKIYSSKLEDFPKELGLHMNKTQKAVMRCRTEDDFLRDQVMPGFMLWVADTWRLNYDTSKLGRIFSEHKISTGERTRIAGLLFHRFISDVPLRSDSLLADARVRSEWLGRINGAAVLGKISEQERKNLRAQLMTYDSFNYSVSKRELSLIKRKKLLYASEKKITDKKTALQLLELIAHDSQGNTHTERDISLLPGKALRGQFHNFNALPIGEKLIMIEKLKSETLVREMAGLDSVLSAVSKADIKKP